MANQTKQKQPQGREQYEQQQPGQGQKQQWPDQQNQQGQRQEGVKRQNNVGDMKNNKRQQGSNRIQDVEGQGEAGRNAGKQGQTNTWDQPESGTRRQAQEDDDMGQDTDRSRSERRGVGATDVDDV